MLMQEVMVRVVLGLVISRYESLEAKGTEGRADDDRLII
jgi:hypothetical protein